MQHTALVDKTKNMIMNIILRFPFCGTRFYNNAAKSSGNNKKVAADLRFMACEVQ